MFSHHSISTTTTPGSAIHAYCLPVEEQAEGPAVEIEKFYPGDVGVVISLVLVFGVIFAPSLEEAFPANFELLTLFAAVGVVGAGQQQAGQLAVGAGARLEADVRQAADLLQRALQQPHQLQRALGALRVLRRVQAGVARQAATVPVERTGHCICTGAARCRSLRRSSRCGSTSAPRPDQMVGEDRVVLEGTPGVDGRRVVIVRSRLALAEEVAELGQGKEGARIRIRAGLV